MTRLSAPLALLALALVLAVRAQPTNCKFSFPSGNTYDLTKAWNNVDYVSVPDKNNQIYHFGICHNTLQQCGQLPSTPICQTAAGAQYSCGQLAGPSNAWTELPNKTGIIASYTGGFNGRTGDITMVCGCDNPGVSVGMPVEQPTKDYHLFFRSMYACPNGKVPANCVTTVTVTVNGNANNNGNNNNGPNTSPHKHKHRSSFDFGWVFIIILGSSLILYILGGFALNRFYLEKQGMDQMPNWSFWKDLPSLVWEGCLFCYRRIAGLFSQHTAF